LYHETLLAQNVAFEILNYDLTWTDTPVPVTGYGGWIESNFESTTIKVDFEITTLNGKILRTAPLGNLGRRESANRHTGSNACKRSVSVKPVLSPQSGLRRDFLAEIQRLYVTLY
jgi:hypothetical protein